MSTSLPLLPLETTDSASWVKPITNTLVPTATGRFRSIVVSQLILQNRHHPPIQERPETPLHQLDIDMLPEERDAPQPPDDSMDVSSPVGEPTSAPNEQREGYKVTIEEIEDEESFNATVCAQ